MIFTSNKRRALCHAGSFTSDLIVIMMITALIIDMTLNVAEALSNEASKQKDYYLQDYIEVFLWLRYSTSPQTSS